MVVDQHAAPQMGTMEKIPSVYSLLDLVQGLSPEP